MDELEPMGGMLSKLVSTLEKPETRETIKQEFVQASALLTRIDPLIKDLYRERSDKDFDLSANDYAVQSAFNSGYRKALKDLYRILYPEVTQ